MVPVYDGIEFSLITLVLSHMREQRSSHEMSQLETRTRLASWMRQILPFKSTL